MKVRNVFILIILSLFTIIGYAQNSQKNSLKFIPNQGQIADRDLNPRPDVLFKVDRKGIYLRKDGLTFVLNNMGEVQHEAHEKTEEIEHSEEGLNGISEQEYDRAFLRESFLDVQQVSMTFLNASKNPIIDSINRSVDYLNYYLPECPNGITNVHTYNEVGVYDIYKGVDVRYYSKKNGDLKYDIRVKPGANPNQIKLKWTGADNVVVNSEGSLLIETRLQSLFESMPLVYQIIQEDTVIINASYQVKPKKDNSFIVSYEFGDYSTKYDLIIDPWITNYGGSGQDFGSNVATDNNDNVLMIGATNSSVGIAEDGFVNEPVGLLDVYLAKFNDAGERIWATYYGGVLDDWGAAVTSDSENNIYITGTTLSEDGIEYLGHQSVYGGWADGLFTDYGDAFLVKFTPDGDRLWGTYYGGEGGEIGNSINVSNDGFIYMVGSTSSPDNISSPGAFQTSYAGGEDAFQILADVFLAKFNLDGDRIWGTYYGGENIDTGEGVGTDNEGNVYFSGAAGSTSSISTPLSHQELYGGGVRDAILVKFTGDGDRVWGTYFGGLRYEFGMDAVVDATENAVYLTGYTTSYEGIAFDGYQMEHGGVDGGDITDRDAYLARFSLDGERIWSTFVGGLFNDYSLDIGLDSENGNIAICGDTYSANFPISECAIQTELLGLENAFATQFEPSGELFCSSYFGAEHEENNKLAFGGCFLYVVGTSPVGVATAGAHQEEFGGAGDAYLAQLNKSSCGIEFPSVDFSPEFTDLSSCLLCDGALSVDISASGCLADFDTVSFRWSTGYEVLNTTESTAGISELCAGDYWVSVELGCSQIDTFFFEIGAGLNIPTANFEWSSACVGDSMIFVNTSTSPDGSFVAFEWSLDGEVLGSDESFTNVFSDPGTYLVGLYVLNSLDCADSIVYEITIHPNYEQVQEVLVCQNEYYTFPDGTEFLVDQDYEYSSNLSSIYGCDSIITTVITMEPLTISEDTLFVNYGTVINLASGEEMEVFETLTDTFQLASIIGCDSVHIRTYVITNFEFSPPNIFSPNEDIANNTFFFPQDNVLTFEAVIVNRWGVEVAVFNAITDSWDGTNAANGSACPDGVYFYTYAGTFINDEPFQGQGTVQLIRD
jgi:hypothetical protein